MEGAEKRAGVKHFAAWLGRSNPRTSRSRETARLQQLEHASPPTPSLAQSRRCDCWGTDRRYCISAPILLAPDQPHCCSVEENCKPDDVPMHLPCDRQRCSMRPFRISCRLQRHCWLWRRIACKRRCNRRNRNAAITNEKQDEKWAWFLDGKRERIVEESTDLKRLLLQLTKHHLGRALR